jgi:hypothetical protein
MTKACSCQHALLAALASTSDKRCVICCVPVLCCAVPCCAVLCCAVLCCAVLCCVQLAAGNLPTDACKVCPKGYWSSGGQTQPCKSCGFGYTSPEGASSAEQCVAVNACPAGTVFRDGIPRGMATGPLDCVCAPGHGSVTGAGPCKLCPANTFSPGGSMEECTPCGAHS